MWADENAVYATFALVIMHCRMSVGAKLKVELEGNVEQVASCMRRPYHQCKQSQ